MAVYFVNNATDGSSGIISGGSSSSSGSSGSGSLPIADKGVIGCVQIGDGLNIKTDGTLSVDYKAVYDELVATDADVTAMMNEVFNK